MTLAELAREFGGDIVGRALCTRIDGVFVEVTRDHAPLTGDVTWRTRVFCDYHYANYPVVGPDEYVRIVGEPAPMPDLPGHVFGGMVSNVLCATSISEPTLDEMRVMIGILVALARTLPEPRYEKATFARAKRRERIQRWKRRAPRLVFVAVVTLVAYLIRRR